MVLQATPDHFLMLYQVFCTGKTMLWLPLDLKKKQKKKNTSVQGKTSN